MDTPIHKSQERSEIHVCPECGLEYKEKEWMEKCKEWCKKYKSCNLEIIAHSIKK